MNSLPRLADGREIDVDVDVDVEFADPGRNAVLLERGGESLVRLVNRLGAVGQQFYEVMTLESAKRDENLARPESWTGGTPYFYARSILDAKTAYEARGERTLASILDLAANEEVSNIAAYFRNGAGSGQNASRVLRGMRPIIRLLGGDFSRRSMRLIGRLSKTDRRGEWEELPTKEECIKAALEEFRDGLLMMYAGQPKRGKTRIRDAVAMIVEICCAFRRSEFSAIEVRMVVINPTKTLIKIVIPDWASKVREVQLGVINDERAIRMLLHLIKDKTTGHVFHTNWSVPLSGTESYRAIARASAKSSLGFHLTFTNSRRIAVSSEITIESQQERVRHAMGSSVTKRYQKHHDGIGLAEVRAELQRHASGQLQPGAGVRRLPRTLGVRNPHRKANQ